VKAIFKYALLVTDRQEIEMPVGAKILTCQVQREKPCVWALVDPSAPQEFRTFSTYGTGHPIYQEPGEYVGTYQLESGGFVGHVFIDSQREG